MTEQDKRAATASIVFYAGALIALSHLANEWVVAAAPWGLVWKASGIAVLGVYALSRRAIAAGLGLLLSSVGDVLLELDGLFVGGMAAFGLAHVCYIVAFTNFIRRDGLDRFGWPFAAFIIAASIGLGVWFNDGMTEAGLIVPGSIYQAIISVMVVSAVLSKAPVTAKLGAAIFMLSDTLIAIGMFAKIEVIPGSVWITYAAAQIMLAWSMTPPRSAALAEQG